MPRKKKILPEAEPVVVKRKPGRPKMTEAAKAAKRAEKVAAVKTAVKETPKVTDEFEVLKDKLLIQGKHAEFTMSASEIATANMFCNGYKQFLDSAKTEREAVSESVRIARTFGYQPFDRSKKYAEGDKVYHINRGKAVIFASVGSRPLTDGVRIVAAHIDSPRLDLKPNPLYEDCDLALFKTHYYGGIKKYQWTAIPLALHGVVIRKDGTSVEIIYGEDEREPKLYITDLLPHLSKDQSSRTLSGGILAEELNIIVGSRPVKNEKIGDKVKLNVMRILNEKYGIIEEDFVSAELEAVPSFKASDIGFDASMIGSYGHDDRVCAYTALMAQMHGRDNEFTSVCVLADKEEIGSVGATGMNSDYIKNFVTSLARPHGLDSYDVLEKTVCISADVNVAHDPTWASVTEKRNAAQLNRGVCMTKYTGSGGKGGSNDASAELCGKMRRMLDKNGVIWQTGELGKVDQGGGGTVARFVASLEIDVVDMGVPMFSMHSPFELVAKFDVYMAYKAFLAFVAGGEME